MSGKIEVITGPMFCGKTTELLRRLERYILAGKTYAFYKPNIDTRDQETCIKTTRGTVKILPKAIPHPDYSSPDEDVIIIDEAQFFDDFTGFCQRQRDKGKILLIGGLDMDYQRKPFGCVGQLMAIADSVTKLTAVCNCGKDAIYTKKIAGGPNQIEIGDKDKYIPCCANCYGGV
ncbi:thymidine kinase [Syntrophomonas palmitatica]|uniref:thymidine kinase n=1 Tax=Syntrophomonas palmitatica TaxID=402877 RepID=UPI0006D0D4AD|nr:AAA family ATPase [Syntrophomonas palmitatica]